MSLARKELRVALAFAFAAVVAALGLQAACLPRACGTRGREAGGLRRASEVLLDRIPVARKSWDGILIEAGAPEALPLLGEGWSYGETAPDGSTFRWAVSESASFHFESPRQGSFLSWIECEPFRYPGSPTQFLGMTVNGTKLDPIELRPGRDRYAVELPVRRGDNEVELRFRYAGEPTRAGADKRRLAVALYRFEVPFTDWSARVGAFARIAAANENRTRTRTRTRAGTKRPASSCRRRVASRSSSSYRDKDACGFGSEPNPLFRSGPRWGPRSRSRSARRTA